MSNAKPYNPTIQKAPKTKGIFLYLFLGPLFIAVILALLQTNIQAFVLNSIAFVLFFVTAKVSSLGLEQELQYQQSTLTKAPKIPFKTLAGIGLGVSTLYTSWLAGGESFLTSLFLGAIATTGYYFFYGLDPKIDKLDNLGNISAEFVIETINEANNKIEKIETDKSKIEDMQLSTKLTNAVDKAKSILETIQADPKDIRVARKFLIVYLNGVANVIESYVGMDEEDINNETKEKLYGLMEDLDVKFDKELVRLKTNNHFDLDVNIDVLKEQIKN